MWQGSNDRVAPPPLKEPSPSLLSQPGPAMPSSNFIADYSGDKATAFKAALQQGRLHVVSNFEQGFGGLAAERYPSGEL
jgi:hypothetical protein